MLCVEHLRLWRLNMYIEHFVSRKHYITLVHPVVNLANLRETIMVLWNAVVVLLLFNWLNPVVLQYMQRSPFVCRSGGRLLLLVGVT